MTHEGLRNRKAVALALASIHGGDALAIQAAMRRTSKRLLSVSTIRKHLEALVRIGTAEKIHSRPLMYRLRVAARMKGSMPSYIIVREPAERHACAHPNRDEAGLAVDCDRIRWNMVHAPCPVVEGELVSIVEKPGES